MKKNKIVLAKTVHKRVSPKKHSFSYSLVYLLVNPETLDDQNTPRFFSVNKKNLFWINDSDFLLHGKESLSRKLIALRKKWKTQNPHSTFLLTLPNLIVKGFNPVSFYFDLDQNSQIISAIAQVTNTHGEGHLYVISGTQESLYLESVQDKTFYVSPFLKNKGIYKFKISRDIENIDIYIEYIENNKTVFYADLKQKKSIPFTSINLLKVGCLYPFRIMGALPRILKQATILHFLKKLPSFPRPVPTSKDTIRKRGPTKFEKRCMSLMLLVLSKFKRGRLKITLPNGDQQFIGSESTTTATLEVCDYRFFKEVALNGEIGFGESYVNGFWKTDDLRSTLHFFIINNYSLNSKLKGSWISTCFHKINHGRRHNSIFNSKKNIEKHYDLGNDFYKLFLDKNMMYSSAVYRSDADSLEQAQENKINRLIHMLRVNSDHHVLEIGTGWGTAAIRLAEKTGCKVTTLTLSAEQYTEAKRRISDRGLSDQIDIRLEDYRSHKGRYDRLLSIEMMEAVGHKYLPSFFKAIESFLKPDALGVFQVITIPDQRYDRYKNRQDWIQKHIFPGGHLPSLHVIQEMLKNHTGFGIETVQNIGPHYAKTLNDWRVRFKENADVVRTLDYNEAFIKKWEYYLSYCEVGFKNRYLNTLQFLITRPMNKSLIKEGLI
jgi:cyclopropane-fatty-acyl-phospholipid synthase